MNNKWHRLVKKEILDWVLYPFLLVVLLPVQSVQAFPDPYDHFYVIYSITRPYPLNQKEREGKENSFSPSEFKRQPSGGFQVDPGIADDPPLDDSPPDSGHSTPEPDCASPKTSIKGIGNEQHQFFLKEPSAKQKVATKAYFVRYNPDKYSFKQLHDISTGSENLVCHKGQVWVQVDKSKASIMEISDDHIVEISHPHALYELDSTLGERSTSEQIEAFHQKACIKTIYPFRGLTLQTGFADLKVTLGGFELKSYLHSYDHRNHWYLPPRSTPKLAKPELPESRELAPSYEQFFPDWIGTLDHNEKPLIVERGFWRKGYTLDISRLDTENTHFEAQLYQGKLFHSLQSRFNPGTQSGILSHTNRGSTSLAMMLPYHVIAGAVETTANDFTYTPFARPRAEPINRKLELKQYTENYQAHIMNFEEWMEPVIIPAVVYDFYSDYMDANAQKMDRQPRLTYWVGTEGQFKGKLIGRRVMYLDQASIPIGCLEGEPLCYYEHARYVGLEYRLGVWITAEQEPQRQKQKIGQPDDCSSKDNLASQKNTPTPKAPPGSREDKFNWWSSWVKGRSWQTSDYYYLLNDYVYGVAYHYFKNQAVTGGINYMAGFAGVKFALPKFSLPVSALLYFIRQSVTTEN